MLSKLTERFSGKKLYIVIGGVIATVVIAAVTLLFLTSGSSTAAVMRLEKYIGEINLTDSTGTDLELLEGMRFSSGNSLATKNESYAYISLDDTKFVKLDELSLCTFVKEGNYIELDLIEGKLIFNVTEKLKEGELLEIKTSTMVSSIRGTSGYVEAIDEDNSTFALLSGEIAITILNKTNNISKVVRLVAGEKITINSNPSPGEDNYLIEKIKTEEMPSYVLDAVDEDEELRQEITEANSSFTQEIINEHKKREESNISASESENSFDSSTEDFDDDSDDDDSPDNTGGAEKDDESDKNNDVDANNNANDDDNENDNNNSNDDNVDGDDGDDDTDENEIDNNKDNNDDMYDEIEVDGVDYDDNDNEDVRGSVNITTNNNQTASPPTAPTQLPPAVETPAPSYSEEEEEEDDDD